MRTKYYIMALLLPFSYIANAQNSRSLSLDEAISLSMKNSKDIRLNEAKIKEATASLGEARGRRLPD